MDKMTVEDVFSLESGWSVEALGEDDGLMQIGDEVRCCLGTSDLRLSHGRICL